MALSLFYCFFLFFCCVCILLICMFLDCPLRQNKLQYAVHCICDVYMLDRVQYVTYLYLTEAVFQQDRVPSMLPLYGALNITVHLSIHLCPSVCHRHRIATIYYQMPEILLPNGPENACPSAFIFEAPDMEMVIGCCRKFKFYILIPYGRCMTCFTILW